MSRHRWEADNDHFYPGPKYWHCVKCGMHKTTEWGAEAVYRSGKREWHRFAPPCPPPPAEQEEGAL